MKMTKRSKVRFNGLPQNADCNQVALYGRLKKGKTYTVLAAIGDANPARSDGRLGAIILSDSAIVLEDETGMLCQFSLKSGLFTVVMKATPSDTVLSWNKCKTKLNPIIKPKYIEGVDIAATGEFTLADVISGS